MPIARHFTTNSRHIILFGGELETETEVKAETDVKLLINQNKCRYIIILI